MLLLDKEKIHLLQLKKLPMQTLLDRLSVKNRQVIFVSATSLIAIVLLLANVFQATKYAANVKDKEQKEAQLASQLSSTKKALDSLKHENQYVINQKQQEEIKNIQKTYGETVNSYQQLIDLKLLNNKTDDTFDKLLALSLKQLADKNYASAEATLAELNKKIGEEKQKAVAAAPSSGNANTANVQSSNAAPGSGYSRQKVRSDVGEFVVDIVAADMGSTRVIVDSASDGDCHDNCPVLPLSDYVSRNGAFAGINGAYFCPATYPQCAGKTNSFDTLLMNKNKHYMNSDNNVYSTVPAVIFLSGSMRFVSASSQWGRDTSPDGVLANQPLLVSGGNVSFNGDGDPKHGSKGPRSFVGNKGSTAYIGVVQNATVAEAAHVLKTLGLDNALNLDSGGSTALWSGGYKDGPGRNIPDAILFVRK